MKMMMSLLFTLALTVAVTAKEVNKTAAKSLPLEIEITELTPKKGHVRVLSFFYDGKTCNVQTTSKNKRTEKISKCKKVVEALDKELKHKEMPSDFINPKGSYWDVKLKSAAGSWQQTIQKERMSLCDSSGKCTDARPAAARVIAKTLLQEFNN